MRLLTYDSGGRLFLTRDLADDDVPPYAILSHTWGPDEDELTFHEAGSAMSQTKLGYTKIAFCGQQARRDGWHHFWVDTCCIDKANHTALSTAITSMYRWYQQAQVCYVYLSDVSWKSTEHRTTTTQAWESDFRKSRWFRRGWTLQELLAPRHLVFYSKEWGYLGTKHELKELLCDITGIPSPALDGQRLSQFPVIERMRWTRGRRTKQKEDQAYCLLGIFNVFMPLIYGEGDHAFRRLQREIDIQLSASDTPGMQNGVRSLGLCLTSAPLIRSDEFVGRTTEINAIHAILQPANGHLEQRRVILGGVGGIGKTQLAIAYARKYVSSYTSVLWLNATSERTLFASLRSIVPMCRATDLVELQENEEVRMHVHAWLSQTDNAQWLLIFDNHDDPDEFDLSQFCPDIGHGSIIVTTRLPNHMSGPQVRVQPLDQIEESLHILETRSGRADVRNGEFTATYFEFSHVDIDSRPDPSARDMATRMAGLPLALVTAGAYMRRSTLSWQQYLDVYERHWEIDQRQTSPPQDYRDRTLYTTWNLSYDRLVRDCPKAAQMLKLLAYFDNQEMWYQLFEAGLPGHPQSELHAVLADEVNFTEVIGTLVNYCLVEVQHATRSYSIHGCVHAWMLGTLNRELTPQFYWYAFDCVAASIDKNDWTMLGKVQYTRVSRHAVRLTHPRFQSCDGIGSFDRLHEAGWIAQMLYEQVQLPAAEQIGNRALAGYEKALGPDHIWTLNAVNNLGLLYHEQGKLKQAEQMSTRALAGYEKALGPNHISTLGAVSTIGCLYVNQGKLKQAEQMFTRAIAGKEKALGPNHASTLVTVGDLGGLYMNQGKFEQAEQLYIQALAGKEKALEPNHASTLHTVTNLGVLYSKQGKLEQAEQMYTWALAGYENALGPDHTSTLAAVNNLGLLYVDRGKFKQAEHMYTRTLAGHEKSLGSDHPLTLSTVGSIGILYAKQGRLKQAEQMLIRALVGHEKALGPDHSSTLGVVNNLGFLYANQDKLEQAERMFTRALAGYEKVLGPDHPSTLDTVDNFGQLYTGYGKLEQAEQMLTRALAGYKKALGPNHTLTLKTVNNLGLLYADQGKLEQAEHMFTQALAGYKKALGPNHISIFHPVNNLGRLYANQGKLEQAEQMFTQARAGYENALGPDHAATVDVIHNLGLLYGLQGKRELAVQMLAQARAGKEQALGPNHASTLDTVHNLGLSYGANGELEQAEQMLIRVVDARTRNLGGDHRQTLQAEEHLEHMRKKLAAKGAGSIRMSIRKNTLGVKMSRLQDILPWRSSRRV